MKCRKVKHSKIGAKIALMNMQRKDKGAKRIYFCDECKAWHLTSKEYRGSKDSTESNTPIVGEQENRSS